MQSDLNDKKPNNDDACEYLGKKLEDKVPAGGDPVILPKPIVFDGLDIADNEGDDHQEAAKQEWAE